VRIRDRPDHHRCLYRDDVPAERPHRDGPLCRFLSALLLFVLEPMVAKSIHPGAPPFGCARCRGSSGATISHNLSVTNGLMPTSYTPFPEL
jgi:hypothetical protein